MGQTSFKSKILTWTPIQLVYHYFVSKTIDTYLISFPKSGRTWVRMLLAQVISLHTDKKLNLDLYKMTWGIKDLPNLSTDPRTGNYSTFKPRPIKIDSKFKNKNIILLVRDPRDVLVSYYFEWTKRRELKYPGTISEFIREDFTLPQILQFMNVWAQEYKSREKDFLLIKYEDLHQDLFKQLKRIFSFLNVDFSDKMIEQAIHNSSFQQMQKMEREQVFKGDHRMQATDLSDKNSYKLRSGKIGDYLTYLTVEDLDYVNRKLGQLDFLYGYN